MPWGFAAGSGSIFGVAACHRSSRSRSSSSSRRKEEETGGKSSQNHLFLWVSEVTLGSFWAQFWCFSVLHCHGDLLLGVVRFLVSQPATGVAGAGAAAAAGNRRKWEQDVEAERCNSWKFKICRLSHGDRDTLRLHMKTSWLQHAACPKPSERQEIKANDALRLDRFPAMAKLDQVLPYLPVNCHTLPTCHKPSFWV